MSSAFSGIGELRGGEIRLEIDGGQAVRVQNVTLRLRREAQLLHAAGESAPFACGPGAVLYELELHRLRGGGEIDLHSGGPFCCRLVSPRETIELGGCVWQEIRQEIAAGKNVTEYARFSAVTYRKEAVV